MAVGIRPVKKKDCIINYPPKVFMGMTKGHVVNANLSKCLATLKSIVLEYNVAPSIHGGMNAGGDNDVISSCPQAR